MKANEAPDKIYIELTSDGTRYYRDVVKEERTENTDIEYVRSDAFIEKACEWLKESVTNNPECNRIISKKGVITMGELIKDFKKYMEGE